MKKYTIKVIKRVRDKVKINRFNVSINQEDMKIIEEIVQQLHRNPAIVIASIKNPFVVEEFKDL